MRTFFLLVFILLVGLIPAITSAAIPMIINYQGRLTNSAGSPVPDGPYLIKFIIYDAPVGGTVLWDNNYRTVQVAGGLFTYALGDSTALPANLFAIDTARWLGIKVGADPELTPRMRFASVSFSYQALRADTSGHALGIADNIVTSVKIQDGSIAFSDVGQNGATSGQVMKWTGTAWAPADDKTGAANGWVDNGTKVNLQDPLDSVGIGTTTPGAKLDVVGQVKIADGTQGTGKVLTSDVNGLASWQPVASPVASGWTDDGTIVRLTDGTDKVGIGTTTPSEQLEITGNLRLPPTTASGGAIKLEDAPFIHSFGADNTFIGRYAGNLTMTGGHNTASGSYALTSNTTGQYNTASGQGALRTNTTGTTNTASGVAALINNTTGSGNTASGYRALSGDTTGNNNTAIGFQTNVSAGNLHNATAIGANAVVDASNKIRLGDSWVTVIEGQVAYTFTSDKNQKENFQQVDGDEVLRKISDMNLTSWNYKNNDPTQFRHYGPVAQEFYAAFGHDAVGKCGDSTSINSGDEAGILMIAVQTLERDREQMKAENKSLRSELDDLKKTVAQLMAQSKQDGTSKYSQK
jgi:hypothetical protein